jgi:hypothetical protein
VLPQAHARFARLNFIFQGRNYDKGEATTNEVSILIADEQQHYPLLTTCYPLKRRAAPTL